jgi:hypothetical protein
MTFVAAKCFESLVIVASDTMISDTNAKRHNAIPGRLKSVIINPSTTIAYAGLPDQAIDSIRSARRDLFRGASIADIESILVAATRSYDVDFLIVRHEEESVSLKRIWDGKISKNLKNAAIGQPHLYTQLIEREAQVERPLTPSTSEREIAFTSAFHSLFEGISVGFGVGGFPIITMCSRFGHYYQSSAFVNSWDVIHLGEPVPDEQIAGRKSGMTQWGYNTSTPKLRGIGVVGVINTDVNVGFIYSPLSQDDPIHFSVIPEHVSGVHETLQKFQVRVDKEADKLEGGIADPVENIISKIPTTDELNKAREYAAQSSYYIHITDQDGAIYIECKSDHHGIKIRLDFQSLGSDPVETIRETIDRLIRRINNGPFYDDKVSER